jgi:hypothetical protein
MEVVFVSSVVDGVRHEYKLQHSLPSLPGPPRSRSGLHTGNAQPEQNSVTEPPRATDSWRQTFQVYTVRGARCVFLRKVRFG